MANLLKIVLPGRGHKESNRHPDSRAEVVNFAYTGLDGSTSGHCTIIGLTSSGTEVLSSSYSLCCISFLSYFTCSFSVWFYVVDFLLVFIPFAKVKTTLSSRVMRNRPMVRRGP